MGKHRILAPVEIEHLIAEGHVIIISEGRALKLDCWLDSHPGGKLAVLHMVGRDATNEISIFHSPAVLRQMPKYCIGRIQEPWINYTPPIRGGIFRKADQILALDCVGNTQATGLCDLSFKTSRVNGLASYDCSLPTGVKQEHGVDEPTKPYNSVALPVQHDGFNAVNSGHPHSSADNYISTAVQGQINSDVKDFPSLDLRTQRDLNMKYQALHERVVSEGFYDCHYSEYGKEAVRYAFLFTIFITALHYKWYLTSAAFLGLFWHQIMFTAHDAGHRGITHNFVADTLIGLFIADFCCGLSIGWWKSSHNVHHLITNHPTHDPDIQNVPLFATCPSFFKSLHSTYYDFTFVWDAFANLAVKYQVYTYYPVMGIARFNLYILSIHHLLSKQSSSKGMTAWIRPTELAFMCCYWFLFGYCLVWRTIPTWPLRVAFVLISHIITVPLHVQITLSHWGMSTADLGEDESFPQRQLRTTMDVDCPAWMDFIHGGLQFQAVHHLFPRVPRHNLRRLQVLVKEFCAETGVPYKVLGFVDGNKEVLSRLDEISKHLGMLVECQKYMAETGESGLL